MPEGRNYTLGFALCLYLVLTFLCLHALRQSRLYYTIIYKSCTLCHLPCFCVEPFKYIIILSLKIFDQFNFYSEFPLGNVPEHKEKFERAHKLLIKYIFFSAIKSHSQKFGITQHEQHRLYSHNTFILQMSKFNLK